MKTFFLCLFLCGFISFELAAQIQVEHCGSPVAISYQEELTPGYRNHVNQVFDHAKAWHVEHKNEKNTYIIPVVVHVVYNTPEQNLHDSVILNQIQVLNADFNRNNAAGSLRALFEPVVGPAHIYFELATVDPDGNATNGIVRRQTNLATFGSFFALLGNLADIEKVKSTADGGSDPWNQDEYLNIWVCNMSVDILGTETTALLGYATPPDGLPHWPPGAVQGLSDGVVIQYQCFGSNNPNELPSMDGSGQPMEVLGRTVTHEVGHYLGLRHVWGDGDCAAQDGVDDTPNASGQSNFDCDPSKNTCTDDNIAELGGDAPDMIENFMDYSAESCQNAFTLGQIGIMTGVLANFRPMLGDGDPMSLNQFAFDYAVFPNPTNGQLTIRVVSAEEIDYALYSLDGKRLVDGQFSTELGIDISNLAQGMYVLSLSDKQGRKTTEKINRL
jgi:hypothetical protein